MNPRARNNDIALDAYFAEIRKLPRLTAEEERELAYRFIEDRDEAARDQLILGNLRLVVCIAKRYTYRSLPLSDLIEEGNLGLFQAVKYYDPDRGLRFGTFASWTIRDAIWQALINGVQPIHIPSSMVGLVNRWRQSVIVLQAELGRTPTDEELAHALGLKPGKVRAIHRGLLVSSLPHQFPNSDPIRTMDGHHCVRLTSEEKIGLEDVRTARPDAGLCLADDLALLPGLLAQLPEREAEVIRLRFCLRGEKKPMTLKAIGRRFGLGRERIRIIQLNTLAKLRELLTGEEKEKKKEKNINSKDSLSGTTCRSAP